MCSKYDADKPAKNVVCITPDWLEFAMRVQTRSATDPTDLDIQEAYSAKGTLLMAGNAWRGKAT